MLKSSVCDVPGKLPATSFTTCKLTSTPSSPHARPRGQLTPQPLHLISSHPPYLPLALALALALSPLHSHLHIPLSYITSHHPTSLLTIEASTKRLSEKMHNMVLKAIHPFLASGFVFWGGLFFFSAEVIYINIYTDIHV
jgi:hypothetical protein